MATLYIDGKLRLRFTPPQTVGTLLQQAGLSFALPCGGQGKCGKCAAQVSGALSAVSESERAVLGREKLQAGYRLCCRAVAEGDIWVTAPQQSSSKKKK